MSGPDPKKSPGVQKKTRNILIIGGEKFKLIPGTEDSYSIIDKMEKKTTEPKMAKGGRVGLKFGGPKPLETKMDQKKADQTKNVKRLMTKSDAYDPEKRFIKGTKKTRSGSINFIRATTDQTNLREALKKAKKDNPGFNVRIMKPEDMPRRRRKVRMASGGRIGLRAGSKGCKLAMKGKGRAYGKNS